MEELEDSTNHKITYTYLKEIRFRIKHGGIEEESCFKEEWEEEPTEEEDSKIDKVLKIFQSLAKNMKKIMVRNNDAYGIEWSYLYV